MAAISTALRDLVSGAMLLFGSGSPVGTLNPPIGSLYVNLGTGAVYKKTGSTADDWAELAAGSGGGATISSANVAFTDGDLVKRVTVTDAAIGATDKILLTVRRPDAEDADDPGYIYIPNVLKVSSGSFVAQIACFGPGLNDTTELPPNETVKLYYQRA